jgi:1,4-alpha-glucan branching enzyme
MWGMKMTDNAILLQRLLHDDPYLEPYESNLSRRLSRISETENRLTMGKTTLADFAAGHAYFGLHFQGDIWIFREWAPNASAIYIVGDMTDWAEKKTYALEKINDNGVWEIRLKAKCMVHGDHYRLRIHWDGGAGDRIPVYARRVVQDPETLIFAAQVWAPDTPYPWQSPGFRHRSGPLLIYEAHVGMAQERQTVGTYREFTEKILPRVKRAGYTTLQLMAIQEHPYYASFGYHVSSFYAPSSRFGTPEELKALVDAAHGAGLSVIMDLVHSHAVNNETEGLSRFDGTLYQYFHDGPRGLHPAWGSRCFDYGKPEVLHFLLSNCRYWLDEFRVDGFRFDGITSMLYTHHGLERPFTSYADYFNDTVDEDALTYLALTNRLIHEIRPDAVTIAEDISGMPGLATSADRGGIGFDYRLAMGIPDYWIRLVKDTRDEDWPMGRLWHELTNRRSNEQTISYAESHDQALVGDQTLAFRLMGDDVYHHMAMDDDNIRVDRGIALHKLIRFITLATAGSGYLNFMGNEFGHPDWIDFPREGNQWSYRYAQRQWHLVDDPGLKYKWLARFDRNMIAIARRFDFFQALAPNLLLEHDADKVLAFERAGFVFVINFHPNGSYVDYRVPAPAGKYQLVFNSDARPYGGHGRLAPDQYHVTLSEVPGGGEIHFLSLYLPTRTALLLRPAVIA